MPFLAVTLSASNCSCPNGANGAITATVTGGAAPFTYQWYRNGVPYAVTQNLANLTAGAYRLVVTDSSTTYNSLATIYNSTNITTYGGAPRGSLIEYNGELYGLMALGGSHGFGTIFKITFDGTITNLHDFDDTNGSLPVGSLIVASDGLMYGLTKTGGSGTVGIIFSYDPINLVFTKLHTFNEIPEGSQPEGDFLEVSGTLYGLCNAGGANSVGTIFSYVIGSGIFTKMYDLTASGGNSPQGSLIKVGSLLYGLNQLGGANSEGSIFSFNPSGSVYAKLYDFQASTGNGREPAGSLFQASDGLLYATTSFGGASNVGVLFSFNLSGNVYTKLFTFSSSYGAVPRCSLIEPSTGVLYGMTNSPSAIFEYDLTGTYTKQFAFTTAIGDPYGSLFKASNGLLYGTATRGGTTTSVFVIGISTATATSVLTQPNAIDGNEVITAPTCNGGTGTITQTPTGGTSPYTYLWSTSATTSGITAVSGTYTVTITDTNGCVAIFSYVIPVTAEATLEIKRTESAGEIYLTALYSCSSGTVLWNTGSPNNTIIGAVDTTYTVTLTCGSGCTQEASISIGTEAEDYTCCLVTKYSEYATEYFNGSKTCDCLFNADLLYALIQTFERFDTECLTDTQKADIVARLNNLCDCSCN